MIITSSNSPPTKVTPCSSTTALAVARLTSKDFVLHEQRQGSQLLITHRISGFDARFSTAIAALQQLTSFVREGQYTDTIGKPRKVALIGFSFGSYTTHGAIALTPTIADAVILTAIGFNSTGLNVNGLVRSYGLRVARQQNPALYGDRDAGYLTWVDRYSQIMNCFKRPNYDDGAGRLRRGRQGALRRRGVPDLAGRAAGCERVRGPGAPPDRASTTISSAMAFARASSRSRREVSTGMRSCSWRCSRVRAIISTFITTRRVPTR